MRPQTKTIGQTETKTNNKKHRENKPIINHKTQTESKRNLT